MKEPICMIEIQIDYDKVREDNIYRADKMKEYIREYFDDEEDIHSHHHPWNAFHGVSLNQGVS